MTRTRAAAAALRRGWPFAAGALAGAGWALGLSLFGPGGGSVGDSPGDRSGNRSGAGGAASAHEPELSRYAYWREVRPLLERHCASCHSGEGPAPVNLMRYADALPWANSIARQVLERRMPPWLPDDGVGDFAHARTLDERETNLLVDWAIGLAPEGRPPEGGGESNGGESDGGESDGGAPGAGLPAGAARLRAEAPVEIGEETSEAERCVRLERPEDAPSAAGGFGFDPGAAAPILRRAVLLRGGCEGGVPVFVWVVGQGKRPESGGLPPGTRRELPADAALHLRLEYRKGFETEGLSFRHLPEVVVLPAAADSRPVETVAVEAGSTRLSGDLLALYPPEGGGAGGGGFGPEGFTVEAVGPDGEAATLVRIRRFDRDWAERFFFREAVPLTEGTEIRASHAGAFLDLVRERPPRRAGAAPSSR